MESEPGNGTTLTVLFPGLERPAKPVGSRSTQADDWRGSGTILLVDDQETVLSATTSTLEWLGFSVVTASDGAEAVEIFRGRADEFACVILDLTMPGLDGEEALALLRGIRDDVAIVLSSGYSQAESLELVQGWKPAGFIQKPYRLACLREQLRRVLVGRL